MGYAAHEVFELQTGFLTQSVADRLFVDLLHSLDWRDEHIRMFGRRIRSPRRVCWYGEPGVGYVYSGSLHEASGWPDSLVALRSALMEYLQVPFNFVLANLYSDHNDSMGWHADNEPELGHEPVIASVSLGAVRTLRIRSNRRTTGERRKSQPMELPHGSLLIMRNDSQSAYQHALPKSRTACSPRINLTFRYICSSSSSAAVRANLSNA